MPSKAKKAGRAASIDRSLTPRTPSTPTREPSENSAAVESIHRRLLSSAPAKYPALISAAAFYGAISEADSSPFNGNHARVWLSDSAMVSSSLRPGSLVSVSLATRLGFDADDITESGSYFAIATVFPSRKVIKNSVRISWAVSCAMGFPAIGTALFICPLSVSDRPTEVDDDSLLRLFKCKDLYLSLVPPKGGCVLNDSSDLICVEVGSGKVASPKTPAATPWNSSESGDVVPCVDSSTSLDDSAVRLVLADDKIKELLQIYASRWLYGRQLLKGNFVSLPICGQMCVFLVEGAEIISGDCFAQDLISEKRDPLLHEVQVSGSLDQAGAAFLVDIKTKVHLLSSDLLAGGMSSKASVASNNDIVEKEANDVTIAGCVSKEYVALKQIISSLDTAESLPRVSFSTPILGGLAKEFEALKEIISFSLSSNDPFLWYKGVLLHGPPGTGKTSLASLCAHDAGARFFSISGPETISQYYGESERALHDFFDSARRNAPAVIFIDELDAIAPSRKDGGEELSYRMVATLLKLMDEISRTDHILVLAATNRPDSIDPALRRPGRFDQEMEIGVPSPAQRLEILFILLSAMDHSLKMTELQSLASATHGFVGADLAALCNEAAMTTLRRHIKAKAGENYGEPTSKPDGCGVHMHPVDVHNMEDGTSVDQIGSLSSSLTKLTVSSMDLPSGNFQRSLEIMPHKSHEIKEEMQLKVTIEDFEKAKMKVRPSAMREVMLELPKVHWVDVGGQEKVKEQLKEIVQLPQECPEAFERVGVSPPRTALLIGPPGCSKTLMARAVASEARLNFLAVKGPELFSKWVGESEKALKSLFAKARANSPSIIFFDEIDGLAVVRGHEKDGTSVGDRVLAQLLVEMDGLDQGAGVTVIAATNRPDKIDHALLRPGRFDRLIDVQPPDENDRKHIFRIHMRGMPCNSDVNEKDLAVLTKGYTGADIKLVCREAAIAALEESLQISQVSMRHFYIAIKRVQPSDLQFFQELATQYRRVVYSAVGDKQAPWFKLEDSI
ncbi:calmodulin-interacting protein 111 [Typha latifolia]|uniref:calmodulin-interacting protein 111 n=1 Tax=Typha latifolia TaxID=4733 RepID=UPI003C2C4C6D